MADAMESEVFSLRKLLFFRLMFSCDPDSDFSLQPPEVWTPSGLNGLGMEFINDRASSVGLLEEDPPLSPFESDENWAPFNDV